MGTIKLWNTNYPTTVDDRNAGSFEELFNNTDDVIASHPNSLADATILLERENTGYKDNIVVTASTAEFEDQLDVERVIGSALFDGADLHHLLPHLRAVAIFNPATGAGDLRIRMYDMGPPGSPLLPPELRSTVTVANASGGDITQAQAELSPSASPGVGTDEIHNSLRAYEFRVIQDGAAASSTSLVHWAGIALGVTQ